MSNHRNRNKAGRITAALSREGLRGAVGAIDANPATPGEVVIWIGGMGRPVYSVREALSAVREAHAAENADLIARENELERDRQRRLRESRGE